MHQHTTIMQGPDESNYRWRSRLRKADCEHRLHSGRYGVYKAGKERFMWGVYDPQEDFNLNAMDGSDTIKMSAGFEATREKAFDSVQNFIVSNYSQGYSFSLHIGLVEDYYQAHFAQRFQFKEQAGAFLWSHHFHCFDGEITDYWERYAVLRTTSKSFYVAKEPICPGQLMPSSYTRKDYWRISKEKLQKDGGVFVDWGVHFFEKLPPNFEENYVQKGSCWRRKVGVGRVGLDHSDYIDPKNLADDILQCRKMMQEHHPDKNPNADAKLFRQAKNLLKLLRKMQAENKNN